MLALRIGLGIGVIGAAIGGGYAIPLSNQREHTVTTAPKEYDTRTTVEIYKEILGNSGRSIGPHAANSSISITSRGRTDRVRLDPYAEIASMQDLAGKKGLPQRALGALPINSTSRTANRTQGRSRTIFRKARNVGTKARARSISRFSSAKSRIKQSTKRKNVASRVNPQSMRSRTRFRKTGRNRRK